MVAVPVMVGAVLWTASQLAGIAHLGRDDQAVDSPRVSPPFYAAQPLLQAGSLRKEASLKEDFGLPSIFLLNQGSEETSSKYPNVPPESIQASLNYGKDVLGRSSRLEMSLESADVKVLEGSAEHGQLIASYPKKESLRRQGNGLLASRASLHLTHTLCKRFGYKDEKCARFVATIGLGDTEVGKHCDWKKGGENEIIASANLLCHNDSPYRMPDGSCNNLINPALGKTYTGYRRLLFPNYADGIQQMRRSVSGKPLPSARYISTSLAPDSDRPDQVTTLSLMQWTQFVEHDLAHTPSAMMLSKGTSILCCRNDGFPHAPRYQHPSCSPIDIPADDPFYLQHRQRCMNYVRSITTIRPGCTLGPAEQINQATHFLDGSMIYGSDSETQRTVRSFDGGKLKANEHEIETSDGRKSVAFFPSFSEPLDICQGMSIKGHHCYHGGDSRANEHPQLTALHTIWLREHNRLADELAKLNPHWKDEKLFQEARKIAIAQIQHITYSEWLPNVIGSKVHERMFPERLEEETGYNKDIDPSTSNEFATAAIRFARSMMESKIKLYEENREFNDTIHLSNHYNQPFVIEKPGHFDSLVRGMATQNSQQMDLLFTEDVTSLLWKEDKPYGMDIVSLDIQRGRDHGLQPYNKYRELCGLPVAKTFDDLLDVMPKGVVEKLTQLYENVNDIDLYVGGMSELPQEELNNVEDSIELSQEHKPRSSLVGPTFQCIIGEQMLKTRKADRHFYYVVQKNNQATFTPQQMEELKKASLARIFCDNGNDVRMMQPRVFQTPSESNSLHRCDDHTRIPTVNLSPWVETF
ncbi:peroxidase-like isoform X2 [Ischnura elegans]|nr:peroxidase-like isoform X2 [Ischnura elegans]